jgi:hypothetical protein
VLEPARASGDAQADALHETAAVSDELFAELERFLDHPRILELAITAGWYHTILVRRRHGARAAGAVGGWLRERDRRPLTPSHVLPDPASSPATARSCPRHRLVALLRGARA